MLKTLLESLLSLFVKKSETSWISSQAFPRSGDRISLERPQHGTYTATNDGYFGVYVASQGTFDLYTTRNGTRITSCVTSSNQYAASGTITVRKGDIVNWVCNKEPNELWFIPSEGGQ